MPRRSLQFPAQCHEQDCVLNVGQIRLQIMWQSGSDFAANQQMGVSCEMLRRLENGGPTIAIGTYLRAPRMLGLDKDIHPVARDDAPGRKLQDIELLRS